MFFKICPLHCFYPKLNLTGENGCNNSDEKVVIKNPKVNTYATWFIILVT